MAGKAFLQKHFDENYGGLVSNPTTFFPETFRLCHAYIKETFRSVLTGKGWEVSDAIEGYLLKRKSPTQSWQCVHGGSSCSIVAKIGTKLYIANVGDSSGIMCSKVPIFSPADFVHLVDAAEPPAPRPAVSSLFEHGSSLSDSLVITAEHSPESPEEFMRLRAFRPRELDSLQPSLNVVYDAQSQDKNQCATVFRVDTDGVPSVTNNGKYYKNVRKEWASLVATPTSARFQDALAFTRSLGDLHLQVYGVTHLPEVHMVDLEVLFNRLEKVLTEEDGTAPVKPIICLVLSTDGVWDNWLYEDVTKFVMDDSCLAAVAAGCDGARRVTQSFMSRNITYSKRNFGSQADNATGILLYLSTFAEFPQA